MAPVGAPHVLLLLVVCCSLCWRLILADVPERSLQELESGSIVSAYTEFSASEVQSFSAPALGGTLTRSIAAENQNRSIPALKGQKWVRILKEIAEWVLHACVVVLAIFAIYYTVSCICACCIGLDLLAEIWRVLGGWAAFSYFVRVERAVVETDPEALPLLRTAAEEP